MSAIGYSWLKEHFQLQTITLGHESALGTRLERVQDREGRIKETYLKSYQPKPADDPMAHIEFGLKYDGVDLVFLTHVFKRLGKEVVAGFVAASPTGKYARQIGFLYEFLLGETLEVSGVTGNYVPLLDPAEYVTSKPLRVPRWRIENNLLGVAAFSPMVRLTPDVKAAIARDWRNDIARVLERTPTSLLHRALTYLYAKETRSSFLIEREEPGRVREERFITALRAAGREPVETAMTKARLLSLQNIIVDPRYAEAGYRTSQNYVGESAPGMREILHYIPPPPDQVEALMTGLAHATTRMEEVPSIVQAASAGFEFVFIHPFDDGNGRLHRFLFQDVLARRGVLPSGTALPISASILADMRAYDDALENFSRGILAQADYELDDNGQLTVRNGMELAPSWRYPDLTRQVEYLAVVMGRAIEQLPKELRFLQRYDVAKGEIRAIVDMPDQRLKSLMSWLEANGGRLSNNKRKQFSELTDDEVQRIQTAYGDAFREEE
jgi:hypothetical protein